MHDLTAKRTLVKSPPELWSELSEVERLARHLGAFGEIRITKLEPEHTVAWEGEGASGTVSIEPSGWGTKVTLTAQVEGSPEATEEPEREEPAAEEREVEEIEDPVVEEAPVQELEVEDFEVDERELAEPMVDEPGPAVEESAGRTDGRARRRRGLFGWLFRPRSSAQIGEWQPGAPASGPVVEESVVEEWVVEEPPVEEPPVDTETISDGGPQPGIEPEAEAIEPHADVIESEVTEPQVDGVEPQVEEVEPEPSGEPDSEVDPEAGLDPEHAQAILDEALEALGSAHHRPFSRG